jgi:hypothetical protein
MSVKHNVTLIACPQERDVYTITNSSDRYDTYCAISYAMQVYDARAIDVFIVNLRLMII